MLHRAYQEDTAGPTAQSAPSTHRVRNTVTALSRIGLDRASPRQRLTGKRLPLIVEYLRGDERQAPRSMCARGSDGTVARVAARPDTVLTASQPVGVAKVVARQIARAAGAESRLQRRTPRIELSGASSRGPAQRGPPRVQGEKKMPPLQSHVVHTQAVPSVGGLSTTSARGAHACPSAADDAGQSVAAVSGSQPGARFGWMTNQPPGSHIARVRHEGVRGSSPYSHCTPSAGQGLDGDGHAAGHGPAWTSPGDSGAHVGAAALGTGIASGCPPHPASATPIAIAIPSTDRALRDRSAFIARPSRGLSSAARAASASTARAYHAVLISVPLWSRAILPAPRAREHYDRMFCSTPYDPGGLLPAFRLRLQHGLRVLLRHARSVPRTHDIQLRQRARLQPAGRPAVRIAVRHV